MDFATFYRKIHGDRKSEDKEPFSYQVELAELMLRGKWYNILDLPPSTGKTAIIDCWIWVLLTQFTRKEKRTVPSRFWYIVDRRLLVDQAYLYARKIARAIAEDDDLRTFASPACEQLGIQVPFLVTRTRGGLDKNKKGVWAPGGTISPMQPVFISSTVDQYGSRLLQRGYGVSPKQKAIHAGLAAIDSLLLLDEAHLSPALLKTANTVFSQKNSLGIPLSRIVQVSATSSSGSSIYPLRADDPRLVERLTAPRPVRLVTTDELTKTMSQEALQLSKTLNIIAIVCNRVDLARDIYDILRKKNNSVLFIGRIRNYERRKLRKYYKKMLAGRDRGLDKKLFVVTTQTIEVGADFDFDGMVSQSAPLDCLIQRFGRMDRLGKFRNSQGVVVSDATEDKPNDPVYGDLPLKTFRYLQTLKVINFPIKGDESLYVPKPNIPALTEPTIRQLEFTYPDFGQSVDSFLHGTQDEIQFSLVYRSFLTQENLKEINDKKPVDKKRWGRNWCKAMPVFTEEILTLPKRCLFQNSPVSDTDGGESSDKPLPIADQLCVRYPDGYVMPLKKVKHGDIVFVPEEFGMHDTYGWTKSKKRVKHIAHRDPTRLILHPSVVKSFRLDKFVDDEEGVQCTLDLVSLCSWIRTLGEKTRNCCLRSKCERMGNNRNLKYYFTPDFKGVVLREPMEGFGGRNQTLEEHSTLVAKYAKLYSTKVGLSPEIVEVMDCAGLWHDAGKADPRFQDDRYYSLPKQNVLMAKGGNPPMDERKVPAYWRHEGQSLVIILDNNLVPDSLQRDLILHLVATHHGYFRPFAPFTDKEGEPFSFELFGKKLISNRNYYPEIHRNSALQSVRLRYNPWELAYLEAIFRLADWRASNE